MAENEKKTAQEQAEQLEYERFLLGSIIYGNTKERMLDVVQIIPADHASYFTGQDNRTIYTILCKLSLSDQLPNDALLITTELWNTIHVHKQDYPCTFETETDLQRYVYSLGYESMPGMQMDAYRDYAERVKWNHDKRAYELLGLEISNRSKTVPFAERDEFISDTESRVTHLSLEVRNSDGLRHVKETTSSVRDTLTRMLRWEPIETGLRTGLDALDAITGGLNQGELCVLAASTGYGKSMLASSIALNVAMNKDNPKSVMLFSLEMMDDQMSERAIANIARVNIKEFEAEYERVVDGFYLRQYKDKLIDRTIREKLVAQNERLQKAVEYYESLPIYTDVTPALNANEIKSMVLQKQRMIENDGTLPKVGLIIVDYLQIMTPVDARNTNRTDEVGDMSRRLKRLAKETGIPILCLAQLNRQAQDGSQPTLSMLRESGSIEQDADKVMFLWGMNKGKTPEDYTDVPPSQDMELARRLAWKRDQMRLKLTVAKNRQGEQGTCDIIGDYEFQYCCTQSDDYRANGEPFDEFFSKYYTNTRGGRDLFWPMSKDALPVSDFQSIRHLRNPEMLYINNDYEVIRTSDAIARADKRDEFKPQHIQTSSYGNANNTAATQNPLPVQTAYVSASTVDATNNDGMKSFRPNVINDVETPFDDGDIDDDRDIDFSELEGFGVDSDDDGETGF